MRKLIKRTLLAATAAFVLLLAVLLGRAWRYTAHANPDDAVQQAGAATDPVDSAAVTRLSEAIRIPTITYADSAPKIVATRSVSCGVRPPDCRFQISQCAPSP